MNLQEFINYRTVCPICNTKLITGFHSHRKQSFSFVDDKALVTFDLNPLDKRKNSYKTSYSFELKDNKFSIDFYRENGSKFEEHSPLFLIEQFKELNKNLKAYKFYRGCSFCRKYCYGSKLFNLDLKNATFDNLEVWAESVVLLQPIENGYRVYRLINVLEGEKCTELVIWNSEDDYISTETRDVPLKHEKIDLPLVPFVSKEVTLERIKRLTLFL